MSISSDDTATSAPSRSNGSEWGSESHRATRPRESSVEMDDSTSNDSVITSPNSGHRPSITVAAMRTDSAAGTPRPTKRNLTVTTMGGQATFHPVSRTVDWVVYFIALAIMLAITLPCFIISLQQLDKAPLYMLEDLSEAGTAATFAVTSGAMTPEDYKVTMMRIQADVLAVEDKSSTVWMLSLVSFSVTVAIMLACATVVYLERKQPDMRALGTIFFVQFFAGAIFDHIFDLLYVGTSLIQIVTGTPLPIVTIRNVAYAMFACRTMIGSSAYSCFGMRQRVIYFSFSKMVVNAHRVYLEAYIYFTVVAIIGLVFPTIATFVPGQEGANYKFVGVYFQWVFYSIPFAYWTLKTPHAARRFNDYHANIRIYVTIASTLLATIIYSTVYPESLEALIGMGYCVRMSSTVYALEVAAKALICKYELFHATPNDAKVTSAPVKRTAAATQNVNAAREPTLDSAKKNRGSEMLVVPEDAAAVLLLPTPSVE